MQICIKSFLLRRINRTSSNFASFTSSSSHRTMQRQRVQTHRRLTTAEALELVLAETNPCDSEGEEIEVQQYSDSELSSGKLSQIYDLLLFASTDKRI